MTNTELAERVEALCRAFTKSEDTQVEKVEGLEGRLEDFEEVTRGQILTARQLSAERGQRLDDAMANASAYRASLERRLASFERELEDLQEVVGNLLDERDTEPPLEDLPVRSFWGQFVGWG